MLGGWTMNVTYSERVKQRNGDLWLLQQATAMIERILGPSADQVRVEWDRSEDAARRTYYIIHLSDGNKSVSMSFSRNELRLNGHLRFRLLGLWGDLLQTRSDEQVQKLTQLVAEAG
jgi:hypothetical protein